LHPMTIPCSLPPPPLKCVPHKNLTPSIKHKKFANHKKTLHDMMLDQITRKITHIINNCKKNNQENSKTWNQKGCTTKFKDHYSYDWSCWNCIWQSIIDKNVHK
jgi:hypothetical protein